MEKNTLLRGAGLITMDAERRMLPDGAVWIRGDRIAAIGSPDAIAAAVPADAEIIDLKGRWIMPGLINTHVHTSQHLGRGLGDDVDLLTWLHDRIWPYESSFTEEDSYVSSLLCGLEQIRSGVTCFAEAGGQYVSGMARAVDELGLRACLSRSTMDTGTGLPASWQEDTRQALDVQLENYENWHGKAGGRIRAWFGLRTIFNNSDELILRTKDLADRLGTGITMHVAEIKAEVDYCNETRGMTTVNHLNRLGVLGPNFLAVHCVWMTPEEIGHFAAHDVKVSHCPAAAMRYLGFAKVPEMLAQGICVSIGTDGAPSNNRMTLVDEMWLASLVHKGRTLDPTVVPVEQVLEMATVNAARAVLWEAEIGSLEVGKQADLVVVNPNTPNMLPMHDPAANMVTAMQSRNIESVMCAGKWLLKDGVITVLDESAVLKEASDRAARIVRNAGIHLPPRFSQK